MDDDLVTPAQIRAGRALLGWSQEELAGAAGVGPSTVKDIETGKRDPIRSSMQAIQRALSDGGIKFIPSNGDGPGVRFVGHRPQIIRKPTKSTFEKLLPFRIAWRNSKVVVFLHTDVLDDLDRTLHADDAARVASFHRHERRILDVAMAAIDRGRVDEEGFVRLFASDFDARRP